jgi:hypothetical protein
MNEVFMYGFFGFAAVSAVLGFALFHLYSGLQSSLTCASVGDVYHFEYLQPVTGTYERFMARIVATQQFTDDYIARLNRTSNYRRYDANFHRTNHLVTAQTPDGKIRNFYAERTRNVRRPLLGGVAFKTGLASLLF